jgi:WD40 repeat protein
LELWDVKTGKKVFETTESVFSIYTLEFSPDGKFIAIGNSFEPIVQIWNISTGKKITTIKGHKIDGAAVSCMSFSPDGKMLAISTSITNGTIEIWDIQSLGMRKTPTISIGQSSPAKPEASNSNHSK